MHHTELASRRRRLQLSQRELAERLGVAENTVQRWEGGLMLIEHPTMVRTMLSLLETEREQLSQEERAARSVRWHRYHGRERAKT